MSLILDPEHVLPFERPLSRVIKQNITLRNPLNQVLAFKVKTTSPRFYSVRPNVGFIEPLGTAQILVNRQAQQDAPQECKDKFLILSIPLNDPNIKSAEEIHAMWTSIEIHNKKSISQAKLRCQFVDRLGDVIDNVSFLPQQPQLRLESEPQPQPVPMDVPGQQQQATRSDYVPTFEPPQRHNNVTAASIEPLQSQESSISPPGEPQVSSVPEVSIRNTETGQTYTTPMSLYEDKTTPTKSTTTVQSFNDNNEQQVDDLNQTIYELKEQLDAYEDQISSLRQRHVGPKLAVQQENVTEGSSDVQSTMTTRYPISTVILVALFAFVLGYFIIHIKSL